jgi:hypothetical protein
VIRKAIESKRGLLVAWVLAGTVWVLSVAEVLRRGEWDRAVITLLVTLGLVGGAVWRKRRSH